MRTLILRTRRPTLCLIALAAGCGTMEPDLISSPIEAVGVWRETRTQVAETTIRLLEDGSFDRADADLAEQSCVMSSGTWTVEGDTLSLRVAMVGGVTSSQRADFEIGRIDGGLRLTRNGETSVLTVSPDSPSCVDYGWGTWTGRFDVTIDGAPASFDGLTARVYEESGRLIIAHDTVTCVGCAAEEDLTLVLDTPARLEPGLYVVSRDPAAVRTFSAFFNPAPGDPDFEGFSTDRISPIGELSLSEIRPDRIAGTFFVTVFPLADGAASPTGATSAELTSGIVDLTYR